MATTTKKTIPITPVKSWSFSRYIDYCACPLKFKLKYINKITEPPNDAMARGTDIHKLAEDYLKGKVSRLPVELQLMADEFKRLRAVYKKRLSRMTVEETWAFTSTWTETQWNDWTGCWVRIKLDASHYEADGTMVVTDWKTGKFHEDKNEEYLEQLELYALGAFLLDPNLKVVQPRLAYIDQGMFYPPESKPLIFTRDDVPRLKKIWSSRVAPLFKDRRFAPRPNDKCRWCWYGASKKKDGGPGLCKF